MAHMQNEITAKQFGWSIETETLRAQNAELVAAMRTIAEKSIDTDARNAARAILAKVQS